MELGKRELVGMADELMLFAEADKCADAIHADIADMTLCLTGNGPDGV